MKTPKHLWSGDWRTESDAARDAREAAAASAEPESRGDDAAPVDEARPAEPERPSAGAAEEPPRSHWAVLVGAGAAVAALVVTAAFLIGGDSDDDGADRDRTAKAPTPASVYAKASPAVASIQVEDAVGSGFLVDADGTLVTNAHLVGDELAVDVRFEADGETARGDVMGTDASSDLAVVRVDPSAIPSGVKPLALADSGLIAVGDAVVAIGSPLGSDPTETTGIVSGLDRTAQGPDGFWISGAIQTDATINAANTGGPLLDENARVVGVSTHVEIGGSPGDAGVGFAAPSNAVRRTIPVLKEGGSIEQLWLGAATADARAGGARVVSVASEGPADIAGLRRGDVVTAIDDEPVAGSSDLGRLVGDASAGTPMAFQVKRGRRSVDLDVTLWTQPTDAP